MFRKFYMFLISSRKFENSKMPLILFVLETMSESFYFSPEKFGYYLSIKVNERYGYDIETDNKSFEFNLESNGRLQQPMKFEIKDLKWGGYKLKEKSSDYLITLGDIVLYKENNKNESLCYQFENRFDYHGIYKALCGKTYYNYSGYFTPKRILVIQMK